MDATEEVDDRGARSRGAGHALAEQHEGEQQAETGAGVGLEEEEDRLAVLERFVRAERREDTVVDRVVEEEDLGRLDEDRRERQQAVVDEGLDEVPGDIGERHDQLGANDEEPEAGENQTPDASGEVVDEHLEAGLDLAVPERVDLLHRPAAERAHDHGTHEHWDAGARDDAHCGDGSDDATTGVVNHLAAGVANEDRQQVGDHRADDAALGVVAPATDLRNPAVVSQATVAAGVEPAGLDEQGGDEAPGDEGADVGHDHVGQERPELLHMDTSGRAL